ncbi:hypothetical protein PGB28_08865 [Primorskyibacter aestuariivivens]|uniref:hypothetical protein n=1 Tax=Primorskyibacter aestuariivivens TaxID=1888912 RepID=UPI00230024B6|nr:hypothetical protein [Primorskyibacter aestuariivivens]MDA7428571.1 hypothetical protein [Primorskyibacter aestuariivivens]
MARVFTSTGAILFLAVLAGCGDPLSDVPKLSEVELAQDAPVAELAAPGNEADAPVARPGLLRGLLGGDKSRDADNMALEPAEAAPESPAEAEPGAVVDAEPDDAAPAPTQRGLFGLFRGKPAPVTDQDAETEVAALPETGATPETTTDAPKKRGLFGLSSPGKSGESIALPPSVPPGTLLGFGVVKPVCDLPRAKRGKETGAFPERGKTWRLYDSAPGKTSPHPFYITGFEDGCARTFTAAVAVFGSPEMHELLRYGLPAKVQPYSETDKVYEKIKRRICKVGKGKPCGARIGQLEKTTVFVSAYEKYGNNGTWFNMLLHEGEIAATDLKSGG